MNNLDIKLKMNGMSSDTLDISEDNTAIPISSEHSPRVYAPVVQLVNSIIHLI